ncbi:MAG TPA: MFS transporter [Thermoanaerobaculia bacterium]
MPRPPLFTPRFISLWLFQFGTFFSAFQLFPVIPLRIMDLGASKGAAGMFLFVYTLSSAFAAPVMGSIADHVGRRRMLVVASALFIVFSLAYGVVPWLPVVLVIAIIHGAIWSSLLSSASALMIDFIPPERRTEGLGYAGMAPTAAMAIAPPVGLFVYKLGWLALCVEIAVFSAVMSLWAMRIPGADRPPAEASRPKLRELWDFNVVRTALSLAVMSFGYGGVTSYVVVLSMERGIRPESLFFTVFCVTIVLVRIFTGRIGDRFGHKVLLYPAFVAMPIAFAVLAAAQTVWQIVVAAILFGIGLGASFPSFMTFIVANTDEHRRARTFGSVIWAFDTGIGLGSFFIGVLGQRRGLGFAFNVAAALACLSIPIFVATSRQLARGTAVADTAEHAGT